MKLYFAPLEGITTYIYRNAHFESFGGCDYYYAPFINPSDQEKVSKKGMRDIFPENNPHIPLKIQVLTNNSDSFLKFEERAIELGYDEINLNIGCPAGTVVKKGRGAGFLRNTDELDAFFDRIFSSAKAKVSVKTRIGYHSPDEMEALMDIFNKYPMSLLIIHPRTRDELYGGNVHMDVFEKAYEKARMPLCYNGDIVTKEDYEKIALRFPELDGIMLGRGAIQNPAIFREINGGRPLSCKELFVFSEKLMKIYRETYTTDTFALHKMKEQWIFMIKNFPEEKKTEKAIRKAKTLQELAFAVNELLLKAENC